MNMVLPKRITVLLANASISAIILASVVACTAFTAARPSPNAANIVWVASGGFCEPETVLPLPDNTLLVSNVCGFGEPGSGFLTLLDVDGQVLDWRIVDGLDAPLGMALNEDKLHVVDNNRILIFRWPDYELVETIDLGTSVANDVAVASDGVIYVTDTARHEVIRRSPDGTRSVLTDQARFPKANGVALDGEYLYVGGARLWRVALRHDSVETIGPDWLADIDGIEFERDGTIQITPVAGPLIRYRSDSDIEILAGEGVSSANHGYVANMHLALIPTGFDNTVIAIRLPVDTGKTDHR